MLSCEKEVSTGNRNQTDISDGQALLVKTIDESPQGSIITEYKYDASENLVFEHTTITSTSASPRTSSLTFFRDQQGRVIRTAQKYDQPVENILYDTIITLVAYENAGSDKIRFTKTMTTANGITVNDSTLYLYNASGKVTQTKHYVYRSNDARGTLPRLANWFTWEFNAGGNLIKMEQYSDQAGTGTYQVAITYLFEYDNKVNPYYSGDDIRLETDWYSASPNNVVKQTVRVSQTFEQYENRISYDQYGVNGKPETATHTPAFAPVVKTKFFYQ